MYTKEQLEIIHMGDAYTLAFALMARKIIDELGNEGESAVREATRRFGRDRGRARRQKHLDLGVKINMRSLFSVCSDLPSDPRFRRDLSLLTEEERNSHTIVCPMAELWIAYGMKDIGRIYCEEFHPACYKEYAWGMTDVNLARTLTQDGDDYCDFHVVLREANVPAEKKRQCFPTCDPDYQEPIVDASPAGAKTGFSSLCVRIYYYMLEVLTERFPERAQQVMGDALEYWAEDSVKHLREWSSEMNMPLDKVFAEAHFPMYVNANDDPMWAKYDHYGAKKLMENHFYNKFLSVFA